MSNHTDDTYHQHVVLSREEMLTERARVQAQRVAELEALVKEFISCVENPGVQEVLDEGYVDLVYTYEKACYALGMTPQPYQEEDEETDGEFLLRIEDEFLSWFYTSRDRQDNEEDNKEAE